MGNAPPPQPPTRRVFVSAAPSFGNTAGATIRPQYVERTPAMWAVGKADMDALSIASTVANFAFAIGSFSLGFAANILVSYAGQQSLTPVGDFLLHEVSWLTGGIALVFFLIGGFFIWRKGSLWSTIKSESRQITKQP